MRNPGVILCTSGCFYEPPRLIWVGVHLRRMKPPPSPFLRSTSPGLGLVGLISPFLALLLSSTRARAFSVPRISSSPPLVPSRKMGYGIRICRGHQRSVVNSAKVVNKSVAGRSRRSSDRDRRKPKSNSQLDAVACKLKFYRKISVPRLFRRSSSSCVSPD